ncbi:MAG: hypothetical protein ACI8WB_004864 [Phenylobacterium sp.]|jgi:hypothetical protein
MADKPRVFSTFEHWTTAFCQQTGSFGHLNALFDFSHWPQWPGVDKFNQLLPDGVTTTSGFPVTFRPQDDSFDFAGRYYEQVIYESGEVPTRLNGWHDLFGALIWCLLPRTKALLNQLHFQDIEAHGQKKRTAKRNAITLLDECGVILATSNPEFSRQLRDHQWHWGFVDQRHQWGKTVAPFIIGHANYEMLTKPYIGLTGKALFISVEVDFFTMTLTEQYLILDAKLFALISEADILKNNQQLSPLPLLGVPGWYEANEDAAFYDNIEYFRPKRVRNPS